LVGVKKYQIIYADPPWNFGNRMYSSNHLDHHRDITRAYPVLKTEEICRLPIKNIANDNSVCFMWSADAFIPDAIEIMESWGFKYKTVAFIWQKKEESGKQTCYMGQWTMKNCELVLLGTKGKMTQYLKSRKVRQLQEAVRERTIHSRKPQIIRDRIVEMFGDLSRIELFSRQKVDGWDCWGNEVESDIDLSGVK
jgi:N6-adenosine-specific RNA methylase IME4